MPARALLLSTAAVLAMPATAITQQPLHIQRLTGPITLDGRVD
jgi:hypothetical protein